jgi:hypothetical protein
MRRIPRALEDGALAATPVDVADHGAAKAAAVQLSRVRLKFPGHARPSIVEPVSTSCQLGVMPNPATFWPRSVNEFSWLSLLLSL